MKRFYSLISALIAAGALVLGSSAVVSASTYPYSTNLKVCRSGVVPANCSEKGTTSVATGVAGGATLTVDFSITLGGDFEANDEDGDYNIVLCSDAAGSFGCYVTSDAPAGTAVTGGQILGTVNTTTGSFSTTVTLPSLPLLAGDTGIKRARISVQSVKRYGDDGNVEVGGTRTGIGVDEDLVASGTCAPNASGVCTYDPDCQPFCYIYNNTPRFVSEVVVNTP